MSFSFAPFQFLKDGFDKLAQGEQGSGGALSTMDAISKFDAATSDENTEGGSLLPHHIRMFRSWIKSAPTLEGAVSEWHRANKLSGNEPLKIAHKYHDETRIVSESTGPLIRTPANGVNATGGFTKSSSKHIAKNLNEIVDDICIVRMPIKRGLEDADEAMQEGRSLSDMAFDHVFHLFIMVRVLGRDYAIDKSKHGSSVQPFNRDVLRGNRLVEMKPVRMIEYFSLGQLLKAAVMKYGPIPCCGHGTSVKNGEIQSCRHQAFFGYHPKTNNSQLFVDRILYAATQKNYIEYTIDDKDFVNKTLEDLKPIINQTKYLKDEMDKEDEQPKISIITLENVPPIYGKMFKKEDVDKLWSFAAKHVKKASDMTGGALRAIRHLARNVKVPSSGMRESLHYLASTSSPVELAHKISMINNDPMVSPSGHKYTVPEFLGGLAHGGALEDVGAPEFVDYKKIDPYAGGVGAGLTDAIPVELTPSSVNNKRVTNSFMDTLLNASSRQVDPASSLMQAAVTGGSLWKDSDNADDDPAFHTDSTSGKSTRGGGADEVYGGGFFDFLSDAWDSVKDAASSAWDDVKDAASSVASTVSDAASNVWDGVKDVASDAWDGIKETATDLIPHAFEALAEPLAGAASDALAPLVGSSAAEAIGTFAPMALGFL